MRAAPRAGRVIARRRVLAALTGAVVALAVLVVALGGALRTIGLPLADAAIIRAEARAKHLDPALIAAVIYAETKFDARTSSAGALGLMQILPSTALYLARLSGGSGFAVADLADPRINIRYGSFYLRYLLDHYGGDETLALAAYNGGETNVDRWLGATRDAGVPFTTAAIRFPETRAYVQRVERAQASYHRNDARELGL